MEIVAEMFGTVPQVAVFDTGFHSRLPRPAAVYPGPYEWFERGIQRYGFHGINHQYCAQTAARLLGKDLASLRLVTCHMGNGCSLAAILDGRSVDTTMGFTPLEGLMMGTRSGSVDPGILTYLLRQTKLTAQELDEMLNHKSGLLGISGISSDMRDILAAKREGKQRAELAFEIYVHRIRSLLGSMIAVLGRRGWHRIHRRCRREFARDPERCVCQFRFSGTEAGSERECAVASRPRHCSSQVGPSAS